MSRDHHRAPSRAPFVFFFSLFLALQASGSQRAADVTIYRDDFGVPHVFGPTDASVAFGYGYAQAEDNFAQIEDNYTRAIGHAAAVNGEKDFAFDAIVHAFEIEKLARDEYDRAPKPMRAIYDGYAEGINLFLARYPHVTRHLTRVEPWYPLALYRYMYHLREYLAKAGLADADLTALAYAARDNGSNAFAIAPKKTKSGYALLFVNPHQPFFGLNQFYEAHLKSDEGLNFSGFGKFGFPFPYIGHNESLGWTFTNNYPDIEDVYAETFDDAQRPLAYRYGKDYRLATEWTAEIQVKGDAGLVTRKIRVRKTHHGPVLAAKDGKQLAVRLARIEEGGWFEQIHAMMRARTLVEFKKAVSRLAMAYHNITYADRAGNIFYVYSGAIPKRSDKFDWTKPVDGSNPEAEWRGYFALEELPQVTNPAEGFVQNCNSTPFLTTSSTPSTSKLPAYATSGERDTPRARTARRLLSKASGMTLDIVAQLAFDTNVGEAENELPLIVEEWNGLKQSDAARAERLSKPVEALQQWNKISSTDSVAMTLFALTHAATYKATPARSGVPSTQAPVDAEPFVRMRALESVIARLERDFKTWEVPWGDINRLQRVDALAGEDFNERKPSLGIAGAGQQLGLIFAFNSRPAKGQRRMFGVQGHSGVAVIEFGPQVRTLSVLNFGQSGSASSKHYFDQAALYAQGDFKQAFFTLEEIAAHAERIYHPGN